MRFIDPPIAREVTGFLRAYGMSWQAQCYPQDRRRPEPVLALVRELGADHVNLQADVRPYRLEECIPYIEGWRRLAADAGVAVHIETHRDRMTTDLFFTLHLLDCFPDLRLTADLSHYVVGREFAWPIAPENHAMIHRILDNSWGLHGRVASREQIQVQLELSAAPGLGGAVHGLVGIRHPLLAEARRRRTRRLTFLCELGPPPYAITGADGYELSDRWQEAVQMKDMIRDSVAADRTGTANGLARHPDECRCDRFRARTRPQRL